MKKHIKFLVVAFVAVLSLQACESFDEPVVLPQQPTVEDVGGSAYYSTFYLPKLWVLADSVADGDIFDIKLELLPLAKRLKPYVYDATLTVGSSYAIRFFIDSETNEDLPSVAICLRPTRQRACSTIRSLCSLSKIAVSNIRRLCLTMLKR